MTFFDWINQFTGGEILIATIILAYIVSMLIEKGGVKNEHKQN